MSLAPFIKKYEVKALRILLMFIGILPLASCYVGPGGICGPQTPIAYCQSKEEQEKLMHPKPYIEYWEKGGITPEKRSRDWVVCGGGADGGFRPHAEKLKTERRPEEKDDIAAHTRLGNELQRCMIKKGYHYTGDCGDKIMKSYPACGAP